MAHRPSQIGGLDDEVITELSEDPDYTGEKKPREKSSMAVSVANLSKSVKSSDSLKTSEDSISLQSDKSSEKNREKGEDDKSSPKIPYGPQ